MSTGENKKTIKCSCCGKDSGYISNGNIGEAINKTGFYVVLGLECKIFYLCKECSDKANKLAKELSSMFKNDTNISLNQIIKEEKE